jgi:hypothetical protein
MSDAPDRSERLDSKAHRAAFLTALKTQFGLLRFSEAKTSLSKDKVKLGYADGASGQIYVTLVKCDVDPGGFDAYTGLILEGGAFARLLDALAVKRKPNFQPGVVFNGTSYGVIPGRVNAYRVTSTMSPEAAAAVVGEEIARHYVPLADGFMGGWATALDFALATPSQKPHPYAASVPSPFAGALALAALAQRDDRLEEIVAHATNPWFNDASSIAEPGAFLATARTVARSLGI